MGILNTAALLRADSPAHDDPPYNPRRTLWSSPPVPASARTKSSPSSGLAAWARSTAHAIRSSVVMLR